MQAINFILWDIGEVLQFSFEKEFLTHLAGRTETTFETLWAMRRWRELIVGKITEREYLDVFAEHLGFQTDDLRNLYNSYFDLAIDGSIILVKELRGIEQGILSNHYSRAWTWLNQNEVLDVIPRSNVFLSCDIGVAKPDVSAYKIVLERVMRPAKQVVFIDNMQRNLAPASALGMHTIRYEAPEQVREQLRTLGIANV